MTFLHFCDKRPRKKLLEEVKVCILVCSLRVQSVMVGKAWEQIVGHMISTVRKQRDTDAMFLSLPPFDSVQDPRQQDIATYIQRGFLPSPVKSFLEEPQRYPQTVFPQ